ncbi:MAG: transcriptional repressor [Ilumatobacteraceae bacterium]
MRSPDVLTTAFREQGLKVTPQRQLLFRLLYGNATHPTADALFVAASNQMPGISRRTVYQTLNDLAAMGELQVFSLGSGSARFDPNVDQHQHVRCATCGELRDVHVRGLAGLHVDDLDGFDVTAVDVVFSGTCPACSTEPASRTSSPSFPVPPNIKGAMS